jgi:hypothetical protein
MIPIKHLDELKTAPIDHVDFVATFIEVSDLVMIGPLTPKANADLRCLDV